MNCNPNIPELFLFGADSNSSVGRTLSSDSWEVVGSSSYTRCFFIAIYMSFNNLKFIKYYNNNNSNINRFKYLEL